MKNTLLASSLLAVSLLASQATPGFNIKVPEQVMTPEKVETRLGTLNFYDGVPTEKTIQKMYDNLDFMRGIEVFLNFIPATSIQGMKNGLASMGVEDYNEILITDKLLDSTPLFLTGNTDTVYAVSFFDLKENGPMVIEIPKGAGPGTINDAFFRFVVDTGAPGPDRKQGGTYIILPPHYKGDLKVTPNTFKDNHATTAKINCKTKKVWIAQSRSYSNWVILRGFLVDGKPNAADKMWREGLKIYPLSEAADHKKMKFVSGSKQDFNTIHANDYEFYTELNEVIQHEPIDLIEPQLRGLAAAIGIIKGQSFAPDARMKKIGSVRING